MKNTKTVNQIADLTKSILANDIKGQDVVVFLNSKKSEIPEENTQRALNQIISLLLCDSFAYDGNHAIAFTAQGQDFFAYPESGKPKSFIDLR